MAAYDEWWGWRRRVQTARFLTHQRVGAPSVHAFRAAYPGTDPAGLGPPPAAGRMSPGHPGGCAMEVFIAVIAVFVGSIGTHAYNKYWSPQARLRRAEFIRTYRWPKGLYKALL